MNPNLQSALNAYFAENYIPFDERTMPQSIDAERMVILKDSFEKKLSPEAKLTINVILYSPDIKETAIKHCGVSWTQVRSYLRTNMNFNWKQITRIRAEIKLWLNENS